MKKITSIALALFPIFAITSSIYAQEFASDQTQTGHKKLPDTLLHSSENLAKSGSMSYKEMKRAARETKQFNKATLNFEKAYDGATNVTWTKLQNGYACEFKKDGLHNVAYYGKGGTPQNSMVSYDGTRLNEEVKGTIQDEYPDYKVICVNEVRQGNILVYVVTIENDRYIKQVTVCDGELNIYKEFKKQK